MKNKYNMNINLPLIFFSFLLVFSFGCSKREKKDHDYKKIILNEKDSGIKKEKSNEIAVPAPPFTDGIFPCSECHASQKLNPERRKLEMHEDITDIFNHDSENRWCLDCHDLKNRDSLKLASGKLIGFDVSYKLCGQCHGDKYRDWKYGVHGKRTGEWNGKRQYLLCVNCHNPHSPKFKQLKPLPPPVRQEEIK